MVQTTITSPGIAPATKRLEAGKPCFEPHIPTNFRLGTGHVLYFVNKGRWLFARWDSLCEEMSHRGIEHNLHWRGYPHDLWDGWPSDQEKARVLVQARINERIASNPSKHRWTNRPRPDWVLT